MSKCNRLGAALCLLGLAAAADAQSYRNGQWGQVIAWPHVPAHSAQLSDGRILTWAAATATDFNPAPPLNTVAAVFNPETGSFQDTPNARQNMFCAGLSRTVDGRIMAAGGGNTVRLTSLFNPPTMSWTAGGDMIQPRWYNTSTTMPDGQIFAGLGSGDYTIPEIWNPVTNTWRELYDANMLPILDEYRKFSSQDFEWYPWMHWMPNGKLLYAGPTPTMYTIDTVGPNNYGAIKMIGPRLGSLPDRMRMWASTIMFRPGRLLVTGGRDMSKTPPGTNQAFTIDMNAATPTGAMVAPMNYTRVFHHNIVLPNGEVIAMGGNTGGDKFSDTGAVLPAEIYNPSSNSWRVVAPMSVPRPYHSTAALLRDGRVLIMGGGICGPCGANHLDGQIYSPPYLFDSDGSKADRPSFQGSIPATIKPGATLSLRTNRDVRGFSMIRLQATTHGMQTDQRYFPLSYSLSFANWRIQYNVTLPSNVNLLMPGDYWLFAIGSKGTPSIGQPIRVVK